MNFADYLALDAVSWSALRMMRQSPAHYRHYVSSPPTPATPSMVLGTATHMAILEPERFDTDIAVWTGGTRRGKVYDAWVAEHAGKIQLREADIAPVRGMAAAVHAHSIASELLQTGMAEVTLEWEDPKTKLACKGRADWLDPERRILVDLKTTRSTEERAFLRSVASFGYHAQLAHYARGVEAQCGWRPEVYMIAVESSPPYDVAVYTLDDGAPDGALHVGGVLLDELMARLVECVRLDEWPGRFPCLETLCLPSWALLDPDITFGEE